MSNQHSAYRASFPRPTAIAAMIIIVAGLRYAEELIVPFALAILFSFLLAPVVSWFESKRLGRIPSVVIVSTLTLLLAGAIGFTVAGQFVTLMDRLPESKDRIAQKIVSLQGSGSGVVARARQTYDEIKAAVTGPAPQPQTTEAPKLPADTQPTLVRVVDPPPSGIEMARSLFGPLLGPLGTAGIVAVLVMFMLVYRDDLRDRAIRLTGPRLHLTTAAIDDAAGRVSRYLLMQLVVNACYGIPVAVVLHLIGIPQAILCGLLATLLRFIPYLGIWIAAAVPVLLSLALPDWWQTGATVGLFVALEVIIPNAIEPYLYGHSTGISAVAVIFAAVFWTWLWGGVGLFLAVPLTVCLAVLGRHIPQLEFFNILLGDQPALTPPEHFYQRLLASDSKELETLVDQSAKEKTPIEFYDNILVPTVNLAERDRHEGVLDPTRVEFIRTTLREVVVKLSAPADAAAQIKRNIAVLCIPANDDADEVCSMMLAQLLEFAGFTVQTISAERLASEMLDTALQEQPDIVVISALPPEAVVHASYLSKRLSPRLPGAPVVVGLWNAQGNLDEAKRRLGAPAEVVTTFAQALQKIESLATIAASKNRIGTAAVQIRKSERSFQHGATEVKEPRTK